MFVLNVISVCSASQYISISLNGGSQLYSGLANATPDYLKNEKVKTLGILSSTLIITI